MSEMRRQVSALLASGTTANPAQGVSDVQLTDRIESRIPGDVDKTGKGVTVAELLQNVQVRADAARQTAGLADLDRDLRADLAAKGQQITALTAAIGALSKGSGVTEAQVLNVVGKAFNQGSAVFGRSRSERRDAAARYHAWQQRPPRGAAHRAPRAGARRGQSPCLRRRRHRGHRNGCRLPRGVHHRRQRARRRT